MISKRSFVGTMLLMSAASLFLFASEFVTYADFRFFGKKATLFLIAEPQPQSAEEERKLFKLQQNGFKVLLKTSSGSELNSRAFLGTSQRQQKAESKEGLPVIYVKRNAEAIKFIETYDELNMPWMWLVLGIAFSIVSIWAWRLLTRESEHT
jgi:hypothetical protein